MPSVRAISFDYGHVLAGLDLAELAARLRTRERAATLDERALAAALLGAYDALDAAIAAGRGHEGAWRALVSTLVRAAWHASAPDAPSVVDAVEELWRAQPTRNLWREVPASARALLSELGARGVPMCVTSNSEGRVRELLEEVGIARHFRAVLDSGQLGFAKPDRRIFLLAAQRLGVSPSDLVHVGDSEAADVVGAHEAGLRAVRFDGFLPGSRLTPSVADARVDDYDALRSTLFEWLGITP